MKKKLVASHVIGEDNCKCEFCGKIIGQVLSNSMIPSAKECYNDGNVPIPNFGWLFPRLR